MPRSHVYIKPSKIPNGFTIVELLIVIVIIAILAAVTFVTYTGITNRAKSSNAASAAEQASRKVMAYAPLNSDNYPATLTDAGLANDATNFQYRVDNTVTPHTFCITATFQNTSYWVSDSQSTPQAGACVGHGVNGAPPITNLAINPSLEIGTGSGWGVNSWGTGGTGSVSIGSGGGASEDKFYRMTFSAAPTGGQPYLNISGGPVTPGKNYCFSAASRASWSGATFDVVLQYRDASNTWLTGFGSTSIANSGSSWVRNSICSTAVTNAANAILLVRRASGGANPSVGSTWDFDAVMFTEGTTVYNYADGNTSGWLWNGATNASTSTGSPQ